MSGVELEPAVADAEPAPDAAPAADGAEDGADRATAEPPSETTDDLLRRLEEEKQEWQRQLAAMKETLEEQDRKIEEDRSKRKEFMEKKKEEMKSAVVPANKAPTRKLVLGSKQVAEAVGKIPTINERTKTIWPGMTDFHTRRARTVAKAVMPLYNNIQAQTYGLGNMALGPSRYGNQAGSVAKYTGGRVAHPSGYNSQDYVIDSMGRLVRNSKVNTSRGPTRMISGAGGSMVLPNAASTPTVSSGAMPGFGLMSTNQNMQIGYAGTGLVGNAMVAAPIYDASNGSSGWLGGSVNYLTEGASYFMGYPDAVPGAPMAPWSPGDNLTPSRPRDFLPQGVPLGTSSLQLGQGLPVSTLYPMTPMTPSPAAMFSTPVAAYRS